MILAVVGPAPAAPQPEVALTFGGLDLLGTEQTGPGAYWIEATGEGAEWGNPVPVEKVVESFLQDGAIKSIESYDNREMTLTLKVCGTDSAGLAAAEAALVAEVGRRNVLTWTPPDNSGDYMGAPCVFDVVVSNLDHVFDDMNELRFYRLYKLIIEASPFAHAVSSVSVTSEAPPGSTPTVTSIDDCTSTTGWTRVVVAGVPTGPNVLSGAITGANTNSTGATLTRSLAFLRSGLSVSMTSAPYVRLDFAVISGYGRAAAPKYAVRLNGVIVAAAAQNGNVRWYYCADATLASVQVESSVSLLNNGGYTLGINDVSRSDMPTDAVGARQRFLSLDVAGSARSQGSLSIQDPTAALGSTLVYTAPYVDSVQQPPLRALRTAGSAETIDTSLVSGKSSALSTVHVFDVPVANMPAGMYLLMARVKHTTAGTHSLAWAAKSRIGSANVDVGESGSQAVALTADTWTVVEVANLTLPTTAMGSVGLIRVELSGPAGMLLDEAWLFNVDVGALTWVECGTTSPAAGGSANRLWIDAASLDSPTRSVWMGFAADRTDAHGAAAAKKSFDAHQFAPPRISAFVVTTNAVSADVTLSSFPAYHTHVA